MTCLGKLKKTSIRRVNSIINEVHEVDRNLKARKSEILPQLDRAKGFGINRLEKYTKKIQNKNLNRNLNGMIEHSSNVLLYQQDSKSNKIRILQVKRKESKAIAEYSRLTKNLKKKSLLHLNK